MLSSWPGQIIEKEKEKFWDGQQTPYYVQDSKYLPSLSASYSPEQMESERELDCQEDQRMNSPWPSMPGVEPC